MPIREWLATARKQGENDERELGTFPSRQMARQCCVKSDLEKAVGAPSYEPMHWQEPPGVEGEIGYGADGTHYRVFSRIR